MKDFRGRAKEFLRSVARAQGDMIINLPGARKFPRFAHYARQYTPLVLVGSAAWSYIPLDAWWFRIANVAFVYAMMYTLMAGISHTARLCQYCIEKFPLNGSELAAQCRHRLWASHFHWKRWIFAPILVELLIQFIGPHIGVRGIWNTVAWTPAALVYVWGYWRIIMTHDRLTAWCPWCRHNRPPDDVLEPDPDPSENIPVPA